MYKIQKLFIPVVAIALMFLNIASSHAQSDAGMPKFVKNNGVTQLYVDQKPFLMLSGELNNSSSSSIDYMKPIWKQVKALNFNTLVTPLSWELVEPKEGEFDFSLVDSLILNARQNNLHLVFLWLASWKNGMSSYIPLWVKQNYKKYPRVKTQGGYTQEVLSTFGDASWQADSKAFAMLMKHIKEFDGTNHTVVMMQVENEVGVLGDSRDRSDAANAAFNADVPKELISYLVKNKDRLLPDGIKKYWEANGFKTKGTWEEIFGKSMYTDELFMAWNYAGYVNKVAAAGKKEYPIPMYANCWLDPVDNPKPGDFPSGCPEARLIDVWKARQTGLDMLSPDLYASEFAYRCEKYTRDGNPLFIPEMNSSDDGARNIFVAIGKYNAIGVSPFGIDHMKDPDKFLFTKSYDVLEQLYPQILAKEPLKEVIGFVVDKKDSIITTEMNGYKVEISLDELFGHKSSMGYGVVMADGEGKFIGAGSGFRVRFFPLQKDSKTIIGVGSVDEGQYKDGVWIPGRRLNGDEDDQGRAWRFGFWQVAIEKCSVYKYE
jgi:beta-galactosidase GanA